MSKTIAAIATGNSVSGIGVIRISGDSAIEIAQKVFKSADKTPISCLKDIRQNSAMFIQKAKSMTMRLHLFFVHRKVTRVRMLLNFPYTAEFLLLRKPWSLF